MIEELSTLVSLQGPFKVVDVDHADPTVTLAGEGWSLSITCPWRLLLNGDIVVNWEDVKSIDEIWNLVGHSIIGVRSKSTSEVNDPVLVLTGGFLLEISADSDLDPWVLRLPGQTFVGVRSTN
jgi:hypothetical protein